jgi:O-antigen/teichoic acid export membrane protein/glycosyltransferase involved in cell wall biosynthesis
MGAQGSSEPDSCKSPTPKSGGAIRRQIRGSTLLLAGRGCSLLMNVATQVIIVRALTRSDYGALAFAISLVEMVSIISLVALDKTVLRFGAIYHERDDSARFAGTLFLATLIPTIVGAAVITAVITGGAAFGETLGIDATAWSLLVVVSLLIPINGFASVSLSLVTVVKGVRSVFFRKHIFSPLIRLVIVGLVVLNSSDPQNLAVAMLVAGLCGLIADIWLVARVLIDDQLLPWFSPSRILLPVRDFLQYSGPVLASDLAFMVRGTLLVVLLGWLCSNAETAAFRSVLPLVRLNELVLLNFMVLFVPAASRLFAAGKQDHLAEMHRQTNLWIMTLSFPIFAVTVALAGPVTVFMFGVTYADAARLLAIMSAGYFVQSMYGLNGHMLRVLGRVRLLLAADVVGGSLLLLAALILIPVWGPLGGAIAAAGGICVHSHLRWLVLHRVVQMPPNTHGRSPLWITFFSMAIVTICSVVWSPGWIVGMLLAAIATTVVVLTMREHLDIDESFPELRRIPFASKLLPKQTSRPISLTSHDAPFRLACMMSRFPKLTETFVLREMVELQRTGVEILVYPLQRERTRILHPEAAPFVERAHFTQWISPAIIAADVRVFLKQPLTCVSVLATLIRSNWGSWRYLAGAILFFPKVVYLAERMQRDGIQHLHAHFASHPAMAAWTIHQLTGIPYSFTAHGSDLHRDRHMLKQKVADAAVVVTISDYNRRLIIDECDDAVTDRIHIVHCGIDPQQFPTRSQLTSYDRGAGPFQIACIGTLHEVKGQQYLLQSCSILLEAGLEFQCHLVGDGPDHATLQQTAAELKLTDHVVFHGRQTAPQIQQLLREIDVLVAPSVPTSDGRREGIPVVLMEGLGSGIPAIASNLSGIPELVRHNETGLLVPPRDVTAIADAVLRMAGDQMFRQSCGAEGVELVLREFHVATNTARLLDLITSGLRPGVAAEEGATGDWSATEKIGTAEETCPV